MRGRMGCVPLAAGARALRPYQETYQAKSILAEASHIGGTQR